MNYPLSILIPSVPERLDKVKSLYEKILSKTDKVEILSICDNKIMSIGEKRDRLLKMASGDYVAFLDDDDSIYDNYFNEILPHCNKVNDVITFKQLAMINDTSGIIEFKLKGKNMPYVPDKLITRMAFHVCVWKANLVRQIDFPSINYGEDAEWSKQANNVAKKEHHIDKILHVYKYSDNSSEANKRL